MNFDPILFAGVLIAGVGLLVILGGIWVDVLIERRMAQIEERHSKPERYQWPQLPYDAERDKPAFYPSDYDIIEAMERNHQAFETAKQSLPKESA